MSKSSRTVACERPNCEETLKQKDLWVLNKEELEIDGESKEAIISKFK